MEVIFKSQQLVIKGNKYIHRLTADGHTVLRIELEDHDGNKRYAEYSSFTVADVTDNYRIQVSGYTGDAGTENFFKFLYQQKKPLLRLILRFRLLLKGLNFKGMGQLFAY